jgi:hypothetical protein
MQGIGGMLVMMKKAISPAELLSQQNPSFHAII